MAPWTHKVVYNLNVPDYPNVPPATLRAMVESASPGPNFVNKTVQIHSALNFESWENYASVYSAEDPSLLDQLKWGFPTGATNKDDISVPFTNHKTAIRNPEIVEEYVTKHMASKAIYGPYDVNPLNCNIVISPLQVAFSSSGKARVCNDLSFGEVSVNSCISAEWDQFPGYDGTLELPNIDCVVQAVLDAGKGCKLWKTDFSSFYKQLAVDPADLPLLGFAYAGKIYFEARLPFGLRSSCLNAQRVTKAVIKIFHSKRKAFMAGFIDDCIGVSKQEVARVDYDTFCDVTDEVGLTRTAPKCVPPVECLVWIGIEVDTVQMCLRVPQDKVDRVVQFLREWLDRKVVKKRDIQVLLGVLNHIASVIVVGRAFTGHILDILRNNEFPVVVPEQLFRDVDLWLHLLLDGSANRNTLKSPILIPYDHLVQVAFAGTLVAVKILETTHVFKIMDDIPMDSGIAYVYAFWQAAILAAARFPGTWLTCIVLTVRDVNVINRARNIVPVLRPMVRHTWCLQAQNDMVFRAKKGICERPIDKMVRELNDGVPISYKMVPSDFNP